MHLNPIEMRRQSTTFLRQLQVAVVTQDLKFAKLVSDEAARRGMQITHFPKIDDVPLSVKAIIVKENDYTPSTDRRVVSVDPQVSASSIIDKAVEAGFSKNTVSEAVVAVDPGKKAGVAFFADEILLRTETFYDYERMAEEVHEFFKSHPSSIHRIVVGEGASAFRRKLLDVLKLKIPGLSDHMILTVPEKNSSKLAGGRDELAATIISRMRRQAKRM